MSRRILIAGLWAAIALVAIQSGSRPAHAHAGHDHAAHAMHGAALDHGQHHVAKPAAPAEQPAPAAQMIVETDHSSTTGNLQDGTGCCSGTCSGGCFSCCGSFIPPSVNLVPPVIRHTAVIIPVKSGGVGLDPEILPKPPKSFA